MSGNTLAEGDVRVGRVLTDEDDDLPDQAAALTFDPDRGIELSLPYFWEQDGGPNPQYRRTEEWFSRKQGALPSTFLFQDHLGIVTITGASVAAIRGMGASLGKVRAQTVIFNRPRTIRDRYDVKALESRLDGLEDFADFRPVNHEVVRHADGTHETTVRLVSPEPVTWSAGDFEFTIRSSVAWHAVDGRSFVIDETRPSLRTTSASGASLIEHLRAQQAIRALLTLLFGSQVAWRSHEVIDDEFPAWTMGGSDRGAHNVETHLAATFRQHHLPAPPERTFSFPAFTLNDLGAERMEKWSLLYGDENFERAMQPAVEVFNGATKFLEPQLMMLATSLERLGAFRCGDKKRRSMAEYIERCLIDSGFDWSRAGSTSSLAAAIASVNNDLKHPDRPTYPDHDVLVGVTQLAKVAVRAQLFDLLDIDDGSRKVFAESSEMDYALGYFSRAGITFNEKGKVVRTTPEVAE